jgi:2,3-dihydroxyphenylpropionate 1,2-dioxygenase
MMLVCASHSPLIYFPASENEAVRSMRAALAATRERILAFDPELIVLYGCDHYGGHQMVSMPAFCVAVEATALADVGGTPGALRVPRDMAVAAVNFIREHGVDVAVSYAMDVDHGFSQPLKELTGDVAAFPVLPIFVSCLQPPFVPFARGRALGKVCAAFLRSTQLERILVIGTGGLSHNPEHLFPAIDDVAEEWKSYHLLGKRQNEVPQEAWIDYEVRMHRLGAEMIARGEIPAEALCISEEWDRAFLRNLCKGDLAAFDECTAADVIQGGGFGAMEILSWVTATQTMQSATRVSPSPTFYRPLPEVAIGFGIVESLPAPFLGDRSHPV